MATAKTWKPNVGGAADDTFPAFAVVFAAGGTVTSMTSFLFGFLVAILLVVVGLPGLAVTACLVVVEVVLRVVGVGVVVVVVVLGVVVVNELVVGTVGTDLVVLCVEGVVVGGRVNISRGVVKTGGVVVRVVVGAELPLQRPSTTLRVLSGTLPHDWTL